MDENTNQEANDQQTKDNQSIGETPSTTPQPATTSESAPVQANTPVAAAQTPNKRTKVKYFVALAILGVLLIASGLYYIHKHNTSSKSNSEVINNLNIGIVSGDLGSQLYPKSDDTDSSILFNAQIFEGLVRYENTDQIVPDLATGWTNPSSTTWIFNIRPNVKFHDGHILTASDVKSSLDMMLSSSSNYASVFNGNIKSVSVLNKHQVEITTPQANPTLLNQLSFLYIVDPNLPKGENPSMAGTGAYELKPGTVFSSNHGSLVAFSDYHGGPALTKAATFTNVSSVPSLISGFKSHKYDIIGSVPTKYANLAASYKFKTQSDTVYFLALNTTSGPLSNKLVREAVSYSLNRLAIGQALGITVSPIGQIIPPAIPGYDPAIQPITQNIAKAKQLLAQAGYPKGLTLDLTNADKERGSLNEEVKDMELAGINVNVINSANDTDFVNKWEAGSGQLFDLGYSSDTQDGVDILQTTLPSADYNNPTVNSLVSQAATTVNPATRIKLIQQANDIVSKDVALLPMFTTVDTWLMDKPYAIHQDLASDFISVYLNKVHK